MKIRLTKEEKDRSFKRYIREEEERLQLWKKNQIKLLEGKIEEYQEKISELNITLEALKR